MKERIILSVSMLFLATPFCYAHEYTLAEANHIIVILIIIVIALAVMGGYSLKNSAAYISAFKFSFGITPTDYLRSMNRMFKKKEKNDEDKI